MMILFVAYHNCPCTGDGHHLQSLELLTPTSKPPKCTEESTITVEYLESK
jgi:hypothetical protein